MKLNPERTAWIVLSTAFSVFCACSLLLPFSLYQYIINATEVLTPNVTSVRGTVLINDPNLDLATSLVDGGNLTIEEEFTVSTDNTSQAILTFFDDTSLTMYSNTTIVLRESRRPQFSWSYKPTHVLIEIQRGRIRVTSSRSRDDLTFDVASPHTIALLGQGSFSIEVNEQETQLTTRLGEASVFNGADFVEIGQGQRALTGPTTSFEGPLPAEQNLISRSEFRKDFEEYWEIYAITPLDGVTTTVRAVTFQNRDVLLLQSQGSDNVHNETGVSHQVNKDVRDYQSLRLFAEVRLINQSLPGGGQLGSEFPIMLHIAYKDADGNDRDWFHGFYYKPPPGNYVLYDVPNNSSERIAQNVWYPYESVNLLTTLGPAKPVFIKSVRIYASGWIYEAMVANISLLAQE